MGEHTMKLKLITTLCVIFAGSAVFAHHGSNGQFNHDIKVEVSGVVTDVRFVNPHSYIYFDATGAAGETQEWRCEMNGASGLRRSGWSEEMFVTGTPITIHGSQARREVFGCYMDTVTFADGRVVGRGDKLGSLADEAIAEVELAPGTPVLNGRWHAPPDRGHVPEGVEAATLAAAWPVDLPVPEGRAFFALSEMGRAAVADFNREMNPRFHCQASNIFHDWWFNQTVHQIDQTDDKIVITYGFMDIVRTIHLDMDSHPTNITPSRAGHSIGKWDGDTLVVDTVGFEEGWLAAVREGVKHSDQMHTVEKFDLSDDGEWLIMTYTINDPLYLSEPYTAQLSQMKTAAPFVPYDCVELTDERVEGF